jgi:hypothetical protein
MPSRLKSALTAHGPLMAKRCAGFPCKSSPCSIGNTGSRRRLVRGGCKCGSALSRVSWLSGIGLCESLCGLKKGTALACLECVFNFSGGRTCSRPLDRNGHCAWSLNGQARAQGAPARLQQHPGILDPEGGWSVAAANAAAPALSSSGSSTTICTDSAVDQRWPLHLPP